MSQTTTPLRGRAKEMADLHSWCPPELLSDFRRLRDNQGFTPMEARQIIEDHIAVMKRRAR